MDITTIGASSSPFCRDTRVRSPMPTRHWMRSDTVLFRRRCSSCAALLRSSIHVRVCSMIFVVSYDLGRCDMADVIVLNGDAAEATIISLLFPLLKDYWKLEHWQLGAIGSSTYLGMLLGALILGRLRYNLFIRKHRS